MIKGQFIQKTLIFLIVGIQFAYATTGYQRYLNDTAIENLQSLEASHMVYNVYENFIVPRICQNSKEIIGGKNKYACRLFGHVSAKDFVKVKSDPTGILYKAKDDYNLAPDFKFSGEIPNKVPTAPKGYRVTYVGCYRRAALREKAASECSLFFMIAEGVNNRKPPIIAVKGTSSDEDWKNNVFAGAPILNEITRIFTRVFRDLRSSIIGDSENIPGEIKGLSGQLAKFFAELSASSGRLTFTGHSLGGALAQELAREIFITTRSNIRDLSSGPVVNVITWNGLSYTSMIGRLRKRIKNISDPIFNAGWKEEDALKLENFKRLFDGQNLSAVNFHTADDLLTQIINTSVIGSFLRMREHNGMIHAGADVLLASERYIAVSGLNGKVVGHAALTALKDALYSMGAKKKDGSFVAISIEEQLAELDKKEQNETSRARYMSSPQYFNQNGINSERFDKNGGINFDMLSVFKEVDHHKNRSEKFEAMEKTLIENSHHYGRFLTPESGITSFTEQLTPSLY